MLYGYGPGAGWQLLLGPGFHEPSGRLQLGPKTPNWLVALEGPEPIQEMAGDKLAIQALAL